MKTEASRTPLELHLEAVKQLKQGYFRRALDLALAASQLQENMSISNTLAMCWLHCDQITPAVEIWTQLHARHPDNPDIAYNLARARRDLELAALASRLRPQWWAPKLLQARLLSAAREFQQALQVLRSTSMERQSLLAEVEVYLDWGRPSSALLLCLDLLEHPCPASEALFIKVMGQVDRLPSHPTLLAALLRAKMYRFYPAALKLWPQADELRIQLLLNGQVADLDLEAELVRWRRHYRYQPQPCPLADAIAAHNFTHQFAWPETPQEVADLDPSHPAYPLYRHASPLQRSLLSPVVKERHLLEPAQEQQLQTPSPQSPDAVVQQYQEHPYPRWRQLEPMGPPQPFHRFVGSQRLRDVVDEPVVLVAGCGTGRHAYVVQKQLRQAQVWAVDISAPSIAYALRQGQLLDDISVHPHFRVCDLLELDSLAELPPHFDLIDCIGVLHHLQDPEAGLKALIKRLSKLGWMRLGLYSRLARTGLNPARQIARALKTHQPELSLGQVRAALLEQLSRADLQFLAGFSDFFSLSGLRDLLLHEREREYDLPEIADWLAQAGLEFMGFDHPQLTADFCRRYGSEQLRRLDLWHEYEQEKPSSFVGMYIFRCRLCS